ncbi:MAG: hypothetical protein GF421_08180 [Candidatus Aminicenantes bacterium]|nr:hypothetical protein [Candidatus Aminicenantes bacterium]
MVKKNIRIGIDTGGTFTDFILFANGTLHIKKIPSTPKDPSKAILQGLSSYLKDRPSLQIVHGTTVATNSLLQRTGKPIALLTTKGFEDVLFIGRQTRNQLYSLKGETKVPLLPSSHCIGLSERTSASGQVIKKISCEQIRKAVNTVKKCRAKAVAISFINSYANTENERAVHRAFENQGIHVSRSSQILPEYREFERTVVATVNAYLMPVISQYLDNLERKLNKVSLRIMQSNEGHISPETAKKEPIRTALSGPAGGVVAAYDLGKRTGYHQIVTFDMGGTSSDVSLIDGQIQRTHENKIGEFPIRLPIIDINTVGAGGGSIAYLDKGGSLRVGPQSAGADPGPACYGKGSHPTVTDANLVLGRLSAEHFLGGQMDIYPERSQEAVKKMGQRMHKSIWETAAGIIKVANANMSKAIRVISIERGIDVRQFVLFSFGGAGGMHAAEIASMLQIPTVLVPKNAGVFSSLGLLQADSIKDYSMTLLRTTDSSSIDSVLDQKFGELENKAQSEMNNEGFSLENMALEKYLDLRYYGQSFEITVPYRKNSDHLNEFHKIHERIYSYSHPDRLVEIVNIRLKAMGITQKVQLKKISKAGSSPDKARLTKQNIYYKGKQEQAVIYDRSFLKPGNRIFGPALVVDTESTTFIPSDFRSEIDPYLNIVLSGKEETRV